MVHRVAEVDAETEQVAEHALAGKVKAFSINALLRPIRLGTPILFKPLGKYLWVQWLAGNTAGEQPVVVVCVPDSGLRPPSVDQLKNQLVQRIWNN